MTKIIQQYWSVCGKPSAFLGYLALVVGILTFVTIAYAEGDAQAEIERMRKLRAEMAAVAKARREGFTTHNNKYGVQAKGYFTDAQEFSRHSNPNHRALAAVEAEIEKVRARTAAITAELALDDSDAPSSNPIPIGPTTDAPDFAKRCAEHNQRIQDDGVARAQIAIEKREAVNNVGFRIDAVDRRNSGSDRSNASRNSAISSNEGYWETTVIDYEKGAAGITKKWVPWKKHAREPAQKTKDGR